MSIAMHPAFIAVQLFFHYRRARVGAPSALMPQQCWDQQVVPSQQAHAAFRGFPEHAAPLPCLQEGTTYNSYLIFGDKTALVDASHEKFRGLYLKALKEQLAARGRSLDYIVVSHTEPDHSGEPPHAWLAAASRCPVQSYATTACEPALASAIGIS